MTTTITFEVDPQTAAAFAAATPEARRKMELLLRLRLKELLQQPKRPLSVIMDEIGQQAEARGLTPEVLESLLHDE